MKGHTSEDTNKEMPRPRERSQPWDGVSSLRDGREGERIGNVETVGRWREGNAGSTEQMALIF